MNPYKKIYLAGHRGMAGKEILRTLRERGYERLIYKTSDELDLTRQADVEDFVSDEKPDIVIINAARHGGIAENMNAPVEFLYENTMIAFNLIHASYRNRVEKVIYIGASCVYPEGAEAPPKEEDFLQGPVQKPTQAYALAKAAGTKLCEFYNREYGTHYVSLLPANLYGVVQRGGRENTSVLPALLRRFYEANITGQDVIVWGDGKTRREFLHINDFAEAVMLFIEQEAEFDYYNVGVGKTVLISELVEILQRATGFKGNIVYDQSKPKGADRSPLDISRLTALGWKPKIELEEGIREMYRQYISVFEKQEGEG